MFALAIDLLSGRYVATEYNDRDQAEWPPHPARIFSALVSAWAEGEPETAVGEEELDALHWLETLSPPLIYATASRHAGHRTVVPVFVPVNDASIVANTDRSKLETAEGSLRAAVDAKSRTKLEKEVARLSKKLIEDSRRAIAVPAKFGKSEPAAAARLLPEWRTRQPRTFPGVTPEEPVIALVWEDVVPEEVVSRALERLCTRVVRLGHSSTPVLLRMLSQPELDPIVSRTERFAPDEDNGECVVRWVSPGQTARLRAAFAMHHETEPRVLPARFVRYAEGVAAVREAELRSVFDRELIVFARVGGPRLSTLSTVGVTQQFRRALISAAEQPVSELLSGHRADGSPSDRPHVAIFPLPFVGHPHSDGAILGIGVALPAECEEHQRKAVLKAIGRLEAQSGGDDDSAVIKLLLGRAGTLELERVVWGASTRKGLRPDHWTVSSRRWASVTPVALDRNPGNLHDSDFAKRKSAFAEATEAIRVAVGRVAPEAARVLRDVDVVRSCVLPGTAKPRNFPRYPVNTARPQRVLVHVRLEFGKPVAGPIIIGAGRYQGLGLFLPVDNHEAREAVSP